MTEETPKRPRIMKRVPMQDDEASAPTCDWADDGRSHGDALFRVHYWRFACHDLDWHECCAMCLLERVDPREKSIRVHTRRGEVNERIESTDEGEDVWFIPEERYISARNATFYAKRRMKDG